MPDRFDLIIATHYPTVTAEFYLRNMAGVQLAYRQTDFKKISVSHRRGLFDLRGYLHFYHEGHELDAISEIGVCIAEEVLGRDIFTILWETQAQRTLRIQLPGAENAEDHLTAALVRVPWEIAKPNAQSETLGSRNLLVRIVHDTGAPASIPIEQAMEEPLRILFVFAEARGSAPLNGRQERREILQLFEREIYPDRRIVAHFLTHGVTRERLQEQIKTNNGYHIVHWSGHGNRNLLELCKHGGAPDYLSGDQLLNIFNRAGGFLSRLFFLSACHSGDILRVTDWNDFFAISQGKVPSTNGPLQRELNLTELPGFVGTAHALLQGGVPTIVAMRYAVGDDYAREMAVEFYRALLGDSKPKTAASALSLAQQALLDKTKHDATRLTACDHATPVLFGEEQPGIAFGQGRSPALNPRSPRLHAITELTPSQDKHFVGRIWELVGLGSDFIGSSTEKKVKPVSVITGLSGMGKTALVTEALALWETRFEWVLLYQAKPNALGLDATLRDVHLKLTGELKRYHHHVREYPADAIYRDATAEFSGAVRFERLKRNLLRALQDEPILIVLDNFETNLKPQAERNAAGGELVWACQDEAWDQCLTLLARELVGCRSRVLLTCRRPLAALTHNKVHLVPLGPLPASEAALFLKEQPTLSRMVFGGDWQEKALAMRLLNASRFHPLLMDRLAKLATDPNLRPRLLAALDTLEKTKDFGQLPGLFATPTGDEKEQTYLNDALIASIDQLIREAGPDARRLLWIISIANQPEALQLVQGVWSGENLNTQKLRRLKQMIDTRMDFPPEVQESILELDTPEFRAELDRLRPSASTKPDFTRLLSQLVGVGLATVAPHGIPDANSRVTSHELIQDRITDWMQKHPQNRAELSENAVRLAYAEVLEAAFFFFSDKDVTLSLDAGSRALVYSIQANDFDRVGRFASKLVTSAHDPRPLKLLLPHLQTAADSAPDGEQRWSCLFCLADAIRLGGQPDVSLQYYQQAAYKALAVAEEGGSNSLRAWEDYSAITGNWGLALVKIGDLSAARQRHLQSAEASKRAGSPEIHVVGRELEALRIDIIEGNIVTALSAVDSKLPRLIQWWQKSQAGEQVTEAPNLEMLTRTLLAALDISRMGHFDQQDWPTALTRIEAALEINQRMCRPAHDSAGARHNRALALGKMNRTEEAKAELEYCLLYFENDLTAKSTVLSTLADLLNEQGDTEQAVIVARRSLAICDQLPSPLARARAHNDLAYYLNKLGVPSETTPLKHWLASFIYCIELNWRKGINLSLLTFNHIFHKDSKDGTRLIVPQMSELFSDACFTPLQQWLQERKVPLETLQSAVDHCLRQNLQTGASNLSP